MTSPVGDLFREYHASLVRMLYRRTGDRDRAEDMAQEVFARAVAAPPRNPKPWLFAVALNLVREDARKEGRRTRRLQLLKAEYEIDRIAPEPPLEHEERIARIRQALDLLAERDREALLLKAEGFNYGEIAATLGLSPGAIGTTLSRARRRLVDAYRSLEKERHVAS